MVFLLCAYLGLRKALYAVRTNASANLGAILPVKCGASACYFYAR
jgi:hypothetical protein